MELKCLHHISYEVDGNRVSVMTGSEGVVFTKNGNFLDGGIAGVCAKLEACKLRLRLILIVLKVE